MNYGYFAKGKFHKSFKLANGNNISSVFSNMDLLKPIPKSQHCLFSYNVWHTHAHWPPDRKYHLAANVIKPKCIFNLKWLQTFFLLTSFLLKFEVYHGLLCPKPQPCSKALRIISVLVVFTGQMGSERVRINIT